MPFYLGGVSSARMAEWKVLIAGAWPNNWPALRDAALNQLSQPY